MSGTRQQRLHAKALERGAFASGRWGSWRHTEMPFGLPGTGWVCDIRRVAANDLYAVLIRPFRTEWGEVHHLAIRTISNLEPPWRDKQRIKNELFGEQRLAIEVMPPADELVDEADMFHVWVMPAGMRLPFTLDWNRRAMGEAA